MMATQLKTFNVELFAKNVATIAALLDAEAATLDSPEAHRARNHSRRLDSAAEDILAARTDLHLALRSLAKIAGTRVAS